MLEIIYGNKMQSFALVIILILSVILNFMPLVSAENHDIAITGDMKFNPEDLTINVGDTVTWTNNDGMGHTATSTNGPASFDSGNIAAGATWSFTFTEAGTYNYKCDYHSSMTASITVVESDNGDESNETDDGDGSDDGDGANETEESPDSDNDGISDDDDSCPEEDASGHDADADGCIDDSDNDGVK
ncbi:MAG: cupredoxin family copper-binding protein, partial [Candidatus Thermoplasmatota archaeon]|nr:cupredoxin family copper-binding protein [Candidatus Thermoplasmatota archaeon]